MKLNPLLVALLMSAGVSASEQGATNPLAAWQDTAPKKAIEAWVKGATTEGSQTFIPLDKRYVVFDNDGTLWPEAPLTFQLQFALDEIKRLAPEHPEWKGDPLVKLVLADDLAGLVKAGKPSLSKLIALTHSGMSTDDYAQRVRHWLDTSKPPPLWLRL